MGKLCVKTGAPAPARCGRQPGGGWDAPGCEEETGVGRQLLPWQQAAAGWVGRVAACRGAPTGHM
jgi:hypothetical protein